MSDALIAFIFMDKWSVWPLERAFEAQSKAFQADFIRIATICQELKNKQQADMFTLTGDTDGSEGES